MSEAREKAREAVLSRRRRGRIEDKAREARVGIERVCMKDAAGGARRQRDRERTPTEDRGSDEMHVCREEMRRGQRAGCLSPPKVRLGITALSSSRSRVRKQFSQELDSPFIFCVLVDCIWTHFLMPV